MSNTTLRLTLEVTYNPNGVSVSTLKDMLENLVQRASGDGLLTGDTEATVESYNADVRVDLSNLRSAKRGTPEHKAFVDALNDVADQTAGEVREDYSGRGMYGSTCYGIVVEDEGAAQAEIAKAGLPVATKVDSMGRDSVILYWPRIEGESKSDE